jgi:hypothetical protein
MPADIVPPHAMTSLPLSPRAGGTARPSAAAAELERWSRGMRALARDLEGGRIAVTEWQRRAADFCTTIAVADLRACLDLSRLIARCRSFGAGEHRIAIRLPGQKADTLPAAELALLTPGRAVPPHGRNSLATLHLVLEGAGRVRRYDRIVDEAETVTLIPVDDRTLVPGACFTGSDLAGNVHWLSAGAEALVLLDLTVAVVGPPGFRQQSSRDGRLYLDPAGPAAADGTIRAPCLDPRRAMALFGCAS